MQIETIKQRDNNESQKLSFAQEQLWFTNQCEYKSNACNFSLVFELNSEIDVELVKNSIISILEKHEIRRSIVKKDNEGNNYRVLLRLYDDFVIPLIEFTSIDKLDELIMCNSERIYELENGFPCITIYKKTTDLSGSQYYLNLIIHHIVFDNHSINIFIEELEYFYKYHQKQKNKIGVGISNVLEHSMQHKDYIFWQDDFLMHEVFTRQIKYWQSKLSGYEILNLPLDKPRPAIFNHVGNNINFTISEEVSKKLRVLAKDLGIELYSLLLSGYLLLLKIFCNQTDIIVGTPIVNRSHPRFENLIGLFVNNLVIRTQINNEELLLNYIRSIDNDVIEAKLNQYLPFEKIVESLNVQIDQSITPLFQVMFGFQTFSSGLANHHTLIKQWYYSRCNTARFDITTMIDDSNQLIKGSFNYATSLFNEPTILSLIVTYKNILNQFVNSTSVSTLRIRDVNYLNNKMYNKIIYDWNNTSRTYPADKTIHQLFEEQVIRTPDDIALIHNDLKLTFKELNKRSNRLAHYLRNKYNVQGDDLIALCLDRSEHMLIAIMSILKMGGAYVPIAPDFPHERIFYMLKDTNTKLILSNKQHENKISKIIQNRLMLSIESIDEKGFHDNLVIYSNKNLSLNISSNNLAYVIYTSGTTGQPKGVMIEHSGVVNRLKWMNDMYPLNRTDKILQKTPYVFDVSVWELLWGSCFGAITEFAVTEGHKDPDYLYNKITTEQINVVHFVPSMLDEFMSVVSAKMADGMILSSLKYIFCSGEVLSQKSVNKCCQLIPHVDLNNLYGPTEASIEVLYHNCDLFDEKTYIGRPIDNTSVYILDENLSPLPIGAVGELYIGGVGLSRGYLNKPELTKERFIQNPFQSEHKKSHKQNIRLYKTGDIVRYLPDGKIEYIGRNDFQVKIRGFRIELGDIENAINNYPSILQSIVLVKENDNASSESN